LDSSTWRSINDDDDEQPQQQDWQATLAAKQDGSFWTSFESEPTAPMPVSEEEEADTWLDTLAQLQAEEVQFNLREADRAVKARQMEEWGFDKTTIQNTLGVAVTEDLETSNEVEGMQVYRKDSYQDDVDLTKVESHTMVEVDEDTGLPARTQMVYVDEHTCIGCTNCAMIAQSTFFMDSEHGRARVFQQWGDDDETIQVAIETCPVDCIHYVPFDELVRLELERRGQNINPKARLVSQGEYGGASSHQVGGAVAFTPAQKISGNMGARCNNCPSRGCRDCPMYGVGKNPDFLKKEEARKEKMARRRMQAEREKNNKSVDL
jgi:ferredoxin